MGHSSEVHRMVVRDVLDNGLRLITETMPHVRSVTIGVWLMRGSRHESDKRSGDKRDRARQRADLDTLLPMTPQTTDRDRTRDGTRPAHAAPA